MSNNNHIPSDKDRKLARKTGHLLKKGEPLSGLDDSLESDLLRFKEVVRDHPEKVLSESRKRSWEKVYSAIQQADIDSPTPQKNNNPFYRIASGSAYWKVAAVILVAVLLSVFIYTLDSDEPVQIAQAIHENITVNLDDGSTATLRPNSSLYEIIKSSEQDIYKLVGEAYFSVTKQENKAFIVDAGSGYIEVMGTEFNVSTWGDSTRIYLETGTLLISSADQSDQKILQPGQFSSISKDYRITAPTQADGNTVTAWKRNELIFNNRSADSVFRELEYHFSIQIEAPDSIRDESLGGSLSLTDQYTTLQNLAVVLDGEFQPTEGNRYKFVSFE